MRYFWCELAIVSAFMITFAVEFNSLTIINIRTMVNYKDLGLVNTRDMFAKAIKGGYAIPAFNFNNMEQMQAIIKAAVETKSPVILQVSKGARQYANATLLRYMAQALWNMPRNWAANILKLFFTLTTEIHSNCANLAST